MAGETGDDQKKDQQPEKPDTAKPQGGKSEPHKVDEKVQEEAAEERKESGGYQ